MPLDLDQVGKRHEGNPEKQPRVRAFEHPRVDSLLLWVLQSDINDFQHQF